MSTDASGFDSRPLGLQPLPSAPVIEVRCDQTGDWAEAPDEFSALIAARTLCEDAYRAHSVQGFRPTATVLVDGKKVLHRVTRQSIWYAIGREQNRRKSC